MLRSIDVVMIAALVATAGYTFKVKHDAEKAVARVEQLETRIRLENEAIEILRADWSLLTSPARLELLAERYRKELGLDQATPRQTGAIDDAPPAEPQLPSVDGEHAAADAPDGVVTGTVKAGARSQEEVSQ